MKRMDIEALYGKTSTSKRHKAQPIYQYLQRGINVTRANHVWVMDIITYIPMTKDFVYLCAVEEWVSRKILSYRNSICLDTSFCLEAVEEAFNRYGKPDIFNTSRGSQFTSEAFRGALKVRFVNVSMDGKGSWRDNVFVERIWRSIKYETVYLRAYDTVSSAREYISRYIKFYNARRPHSSLDRQTPDEFYYRSLPAVKLAA